MVRIPQLPEGYQFDYINAEVLLRDASVHDGKLCLPHGTSYRVLVLPRQETMRPEVARKIRELAAAGATILGPAPARSPSLERYPTADAEVAAVAAELWGGLAEVIPEGRAFGRGRVFRDASLQEVLAATGCPPDCTGPDGMLFNHRQTEGTEIYFLSNQRDTAVCGPVTFRTAGLAPELWNPLTGEIRPLPEYTAEEGRTTVPMEFASYGSAFVLFRKSAVGGAGKNFPVPNRRIVPDAAWRVSFDGRFAVPAPRSMPQLCDLSQSACDSVRYFSGTIVYENRFDLEQQPSGHAWLDLGQVREMAKVWVNGRYAGGAWTPPYRVEVGSLLRAGENDLRIEVVNTWVNRLIGDQQLPSAARQTWCPVNPYRSDSPLPPSGLLGEVALCY